MRTFQKFGIFFLAFILCTFFQSTLFAKTTPKKASTKKTKPAPASHKTPSSTAKLWGLGPFIGTDIGVSYKYWFGDTSPFAVQAAFGYDFSDGLMLFSDTLYHFKNLTEVNFFSPGDLHAYTGGGVKVTFYEPTVYIRIPVGANLVYHEPYDLFFEIAPAIKVTPAIGGKVDVGLGGRYYF